MIPTFFTTLVTGTITSVVASVLALSTWITGSVIYQGNQFLDTTNNATPGFYLNDETTAIKTYPVTHGTEYCEGHTGALLCTVMIKLTGSGGHRAHNAGSYTCGTQTCSIIDTRVFTESGADNLYGGWTFEPHSASGAQIFNNKRTRNGFTLIGSGSTTPNGPDAGTVVNRINDVPPGATIKFTWRVGNSTEDYSRTKAAALIRFWKYYIP